MALRCSVFIATSLDGYIARPDGAIDWLTGAATSGEDHGYDAFVADVDLVVMGRGTFEKVLTFTPWPYAGRRVVVLSRTMAVVAVPETLRETVSVHPGPVGTALVRALEADGASHAYVDGGQVIQAFLRAGLIDDMIVTRLPVLLGSGRPLFGELPADVWWEHVGTRAFPSGLVQSEYRRRAGPGG